MVAPFRLDNLCLFNTFSFNYILENYSQGYNILFFVILLPCSALHLQVEVSFLLGPFKHVVLYLLLYCSLDFILLSFSTFAYQEESKQIILEYSLKGFLFVSVENLK